MKKKIIIIIIIVILIFLGFKLYIKYQSSTNLCFEAMWVGEHMETGECKAFSAICPRAPSQKNYVKGSEKCGFIKAMAILQNTTLITQLCDNLNEETKPKVFSHYNINSCEEIEKIHKNMKEVKS